MKPSKIILAALLGLSLCAPTVINAGPCEAPAQPCPPCAGQKMPPAPCMKAAPQLQVITPEQRQKYYDIMKEFASKKQSIKEQLFVKKNVLQALTHSAKADVAKVEATANEIVKLKAAKRELQKALDAKVANECGIVKPAKPIPGVDILPPHSRGWAKKQELTPEQRQKYYAIMKEFAPQIQSIRDQIFIKKNVLQALKHSENVDVAKVEATATEIVKLKAEKRALKKAFSEKVAKECGIVKPAKPIPGVDVPFRPFHGKPHDHPGHHGHPHFHHGPMM